MGAQSVSHPKLDSATVCVLTHMGARYEFPDMDREVLQRLLPKLSDRLPNHGQLILVNASISCLSVPSRIIKEVTVGGEVWWTNPNEYNTD